MTTCEFKKILSFLISLIIGSLFLIGAMGCQPKKGGSTKSTSSSPSDGSNNGGQSSDGQSESSSGSADDSSSQTSTTTSDGQPALFNFSLDNGTFNLLTSSSLSSKSFSSSIGTKQIIQYSYQFISLSSTVSLEGKCNADVVGIDVRPNDGSLVLTNQCVEKGIWSISPFSLVANETRDLTFTVLNRSGQLYVFQLEISYPQSSSNAGLEFTSSNISSNYLSTSDQVSTLVGICDSSIVALEVNNSGVTISDGDCSNGDFTLLTNQNLTSGLHSITLTGTTSSGGTVSLDFIINYYALEPSITISVPTAELTFSTTEPNLSLSGSCNAGVASISVYIDGSPITQTVTNRCSSSSYWYIDSPLSLTSTSDYAIQVIGSSLYGQTVQDQLTISYTVSTSGDPLNEDSANDITSLNYLLLQTFQGYVSSYGFTTNNNNPYQITGRCSAGQVVTISPTTYVSDLLSNCESDQWSVTIELPSNVTSASYTVSGSGSGTMAQFSLTKDTTPPALSIDPQFFTGSQIVTNTTPFLITGTCSSDVVSIVEKTSGKLRSSANLRCASNGTFSIVTNDSTHLVQGPQQVTIQALDGASNSTTYSFELLYLTGEPEVSFIEPPAEDYPVSSSPYILSGSCSEYVTSLSLTHNSGTPEVVVCSSGSWNSSSLSLTDGSNTFTLSSQDIAGNTGSIQTSVYYSYINATTPNVNQAPIAYQGLPYEWTGFNFSTNSASITYSFRFNGTSVSWLNFDEGAGKIYGTVPDNVIDTVIGGIYLDYTDGQTTGSFGPFTLTIKYDPLYFQQWHLNNTGQTAFSSGYGTSGNDLNIPNDLIGPNFIPTQRPVVLISDDGLEISHPDLRSNTSYTYSFLSSLNYNFATGSNDPSPRYTDETHGTSVAGIIGATGWNNIGGRGVSPYAYLVGMNILNSDPSYVFTQQDVNDAVWNDVEAINQSWGLNVGDFGTTDFYPACDTSDSISDFYSASDTRSPYASDEGNSASDYSVYGLSLSKATGTYVNPSTMQLEVSNENRNGKGVIIVKAIGNEYTWLHNGNLDWYSSFPYTVNVGAINSNGVKASYSSVGSNLWVSAPGGEFGDTSPAIVTTDLSGCLYGYSPSGVIGQDGYYPLLNYTDSTDQLQYDPNCDYTANFNGSSAATPMVTGVVAEMLGKNPDLTWRDVKYILASTAVQIDSSSTTTDVANEPACLGASYPSGHTYEDGWTTNAAGFNFHNHYGFGLVDAQAAIIMARDYPPASILSNNTFISVSTVGVVLADSIPDNDANGLTKTFDVNALTSISSIEAVQVFISTSHSYPGDLGFELTSPNGTKSILLNVNNTLGGVTDFNETPFISNAFYGEGTHDGTAIWTLKVIDGSANDTGNLTYVKFIFYGEQ